MRTHARNVPLAVPKQLYSFSRAQYEAYQPMAEREMHAIIAEARKQWDLRHVAIAHRTGVVPTTESSVEIAISSAHRREALEAVHFVIDKLKAQASPQGPRVGANDTGRSGASPGLACVSPPSGGAGAYLEEGGLRGRERQLEGEQGVCCTYDRPGSGQGHRTGRRGINTHGPRRRSCRSWRPCLELGGTTQAILIARANTSMHGCRTPGGAHRELSFCHASA